MAAASGGLDALVFTGGVGEHSSEVRQAAADPLAFLGVVLDPSKNEQTRSGDADILAPAATVTSLVVEAREDLEIARETRAALTTGVQRESP